MPDQWTAIPSHYEVGQIWEGHVRVLARFGAFIRLPDGTDTLVELAHMTDDWRPSPGSGGRSPAAYVTVGEIVRVRVRAIYEGR